jgi:hypothetical protein
MNPVSRRATTTSLQATSLRPEAMKALLTIASAFAAMLGVSCHPSPVLRPENDREIARTSDPNVLAMVLEPFAAKETSRAYVRLTLENQSDDWMYVNSALGLGPKESPSTLWADVNDTKTDAPCHWSCLIKSLPAGPPRYIELPPSGRFSLVLPLSCYEPPRTGSARIVIHFREVRKEAPKADNPVAVWFSGKSVSNAIQVAIPPSTKTESNPREAGSH